MCYRKYLQHIFFDFEYGRAVSFEVNTGTLLLVLSDRTQPPFAPHVSDKVRYIALYRSRSLERSSDSDRGNVEVTVRFLRYKRATTSATGCGNFRMENNSPNLAAGA